MVGFLILVFFLRVMFSSFKKTLLFSPYISCDNQESLFVSYTFSLWIFWYSTQFPLVLKLKPSKYSQGCNQSPEFYSGLWNVRLTFVLIYCLKTQKRETKESFKKMSFLKMSFQTTMKICMHTRLFNSFCWILPVFKIDILLVILPESE